MNHSTLFHQPFPADYPVTSSGFPVDDDDHRRASSLGQRMAQPVSIPATNGLRYNTQPSAMHDVPFDTSPTMLMSPTDSCSEPFSPASNSLYSHSSSLSYDRLSDFRPHRVTPLQPPTSQQGTVPNSSILGRNDSFPSSYTSHRGPYLPLSGYNDRMPSYTGNPRILDSTIDHTSSLGFGQTGNMYMDPMQRFSQSTADAPPFNDTDILHHPIIGSGGQTAKIEIQAKIHNKKFLNVDDKWTCYRRNYLAISCSFSLHPWSPGPFHLKTNHGTEQIRSFSMSISAIVNAQHEEVRELVQHTPKRDKQSERAPGRVRLQPLQQSTLGIGRGSAASSNGQHGFTLTSQPASLLDYGASYANASQSSQPPTHHTFERIQFQKATANNGKRRLQQQYYNLMVELHAEIATPTGTEWVKIARRISQPMVVRGRSPGHYRDGRPGSSASTASMGPDGHGSSDSSMLHPGLPESNLTLMPYDSSERGGMAYSRGPGYSHSVKPEQSPLDDSPRLSSSSSSSSALGIGMLNDSMDPMDTIKGYAATMTCPPSQQPSTVTTTTSSTATTIGGSSYRHPLSSFDYDVFTKADTGAAGSTGSNFPDAVGSMVSMMPHDQNEFLRNPPHLPSQHSQATSGSGGYDTIYSNLRPGDDSSSYRFDSIPNPQGLCT